MKRENYLNTKVDQLFKTFKDKYGFDLDKSEALAICEEHLKEDTKNFVVRALLDVQGNKSDIKNIIDILKTESKAPEPEYKSKSEEKRVESLKAKPEMSAEVKTIVKKATKKKTKKKAVKKK